MRAANVSAAPEVALKRALRGSLAPTAATRLRHRVDMAHCVLTGHVVHWGVCPRCERKALG